MRKPKASQRSQHTTADEKRIEDEWEGVDLEKLEPEVVELDPSLVGTIHARRRPQQAMRSKRQHRKPKAD